MSPRFFFHLKSETSVFYLAFPDNIISVEESWEGEKWMESPKILTEFETPALAFCLHPSKNILFSWHENGDLCFISCTTWRTKKLGRIRQLEGEEIRNFSILKTSDVRSNTLEMLRKDNQSEEGLVLFVQYGDDRLLLVMSLIDGCVSSPVNLWALRGKHPFLEFYQASVPKSIDDLLKRRKRELLSNDWFEYDDIEDIQFYAKGFCTLQNSGDLYHYEFLRPSRVIVSSITHFCIRSGYGSCISRSGIIYGFPLPLVESSPFFKTEIEFKNRPEICRNILEYSVQLGRINAILAENERILRQYHLLPKMKSSTFRITSSLSEEGKVINFEIMSVLERPLEGKFYSLSAVLVPYGSSRQIYQTIPFPQKFPKLESWKVSLNLPECLQNPSSLPLNVKLYVVFVALDKIRIQSRFIFETQFSALDFFRIAHQCMLPLQVGDAKGKGFEQSIEEFLDELNSKRRVAKALVGKEDPSSIKEKNCLSVVLSNSAFETKLHLSFKYSYLKLFDINQGCYLRKETIEGKCLFSTFTFMVSDTDLRAAVKRGIIQLISDVALESSSRFIKSEVFQDLRTLRKRLDNLGFKEDPIKLKKLYAFLRNDVSSALL